LSRVVTSSKVLEYRRVRYGIDRACVRRTEARDFTLRAVHIWIFKASQTSIIVGRNMNLAPKNLYRIPHEPKTRSPSLQCHVPRKSKMADKVDTFCVCYIAKHQSCERFALVASSLSQEKEP
jgi:hypothetical protein